MTKLRVFIALGLALFLASTTPAQTRRKRTRRAPSTTKSAPAPKPVEQLGVTTASGLTYVITHKEAGRRPQTGETVLVHYTGMLPDGKKFDSSHDRNDPIAFPLGTGAVIKGWDEGIAQLGVGDEAVLIIPPQLGYGARGAGAVIPPNATLIFVVHLVAIKQASLSQLLMKTIATDGIEAAVAKYRTLKAEGFGDVYASESELNGLGYRLLQQRKTAEAIEILKLNVEAYPNSANVYDSLAEAYMLSGNTELATANYQKSLELDPSNANAAQMLERLKARP